MEPVRSLATVTGGMRVQERQAGKQGDAEAFRRALQQGAGEARQEEPVRPALQSRRPDSRRADGTTARHVDVIA